MSKEVVSSKISPEDCAKRITELTALQAELNMIDRIYEDRIHVTSSWSGQPYTQLINEIFQTKKKCAEKYGISF